MALVCLCALPLLAGCFGMAGTGAGPRLSAATARMQADIISAGDFQITVYQTITDPAQPATIYIEGDGRAWLTRTRPSADPTPTDPVALRLAAQDPAANVIYIARPCQYTQSPACNISLWTGARFAPPLVAAMNDTITTLTRRHGITGVRLVGYSGGGAMAALIAARRDDVIDLRTVAGNIDHRAQSRLLGVSMLEASQNPPDHAAALRTMPQIHFIGADDNIVPRGIYASYEAAMGQSPCVQAAVIPGVGHDGDGWTAQWPRLLSKVPTCAAE